MKDKTSIWPGEKEVWKQLSKMDPRDVCTRTGVAFDSTENNYILVSFNEKICISVAKKSIFSHSPAGNILVTEFADLSRISILNYLIQLKNVTLSGELINPSNLSGGEIYVKGAHVLPLDQMVKSFAENPEELLNKAKRLGSKSLDYGNVSFELLPFPKLPVVIVLWEQDEEFPGMSTLLFDSSCCFQVPTDILWATAMMTIEMVLCENI